MLAAAEAKLPPSGGVNYSKRPPEVSPMFLSRYTSAGTKNLFWEGNLGRGSPDAQLTLISVSVKRPSSFFLRSFFSGLGQHGRAEGDQQVLSARL